MSELPNPNNQFRATLDYDLSLTNLNAIFGGMWDALQPYRDVVVQADAAINALNARTLQVIGDSITPELDQLRAATAEAQEAVDALIGNDFEGDLAGKLAKDQNLEDLPDKGSARTALGLGEGATASIAGQTIAEGGLRNDLLMTPLRTAQAIAALTPTPTIPGLVPIGTKQTLSSVAAADILLTGNYDEYVIKFWGFVPSDLSADLVLRTSGDNGASFDSGGSDYVEEVLYAQSSGTGAAGLEHAHIRIAAWNSGRDVQDDPEGGATGEVKISQPRSDRWTVIRNDSGYFDGLTAPIIHVSFAARRSTDDVNAARVFFDSGNITSGEYQLYGVTTA